MNINFFMHNHEFLKHFGPNLIKTLLSATKITNTHSLRDGSSRQKVRQVDSSVKNRRRLSTEREYKIMKIDDSQRREALSAFTSAWQRQQLPHQR